MSGCPGKIHFLNQNGVSPPDALFVDVRMSFFGLRTFCKCPAKRTKKKCPSGRFFGHRQKVRPAERQNFDLRNEKAQKKNVSKYCTPTDGIMMRFASSTLFKL